MQPQQPQPQDSEATKRQPIESTTQKGSQPKPKKKQKKLKENPFEDLVLRDDNSPNKDSPNAENQWIKPKTTPLTVTVVDHSRINKFYSHKSLQKYIKYLYVRNCPNPLWLSIKRQSQVEHIIFVDIQVENNLFHYYFGSRECENGSGGNQNGKEEKEVKPVLKFLAKYNTPERKAIFKQCPFLKQSRDVLDAMLVYDNEAVKEQMSAITFAQLPVKLSEQILQIYQTYTLTDDQLKYNLYPIPQLPAYQEYYSIKNQKQPELKNKILIIDCQMVMCGNNFELARASIMNFQGQLIYDELFKPQKLITNYNTQFSGITEETLKDVKKGVRDLHEDLEKIVSKETILVGHSLQNDLHAMKVVHSRVVDTSVLYARKNGSKMKLKTLASSILKRSIQVGTHCSSEDCKATLQLMRHKIEASNTESQQHKAYHLLDQLQEQSKKVVIIDSDLDFIKHRKQYLGVHFEQIEYATENKENYLNKFIKYFDHNVRNPELILSRIRKGIAQQWQDYYRGMDAVVEQLYEKCTDRTVFMLNFQVNNACEVFPLRTQDVLERRRTFCLFIVKSK